MYVLVSCRLGSALEWRKPLLVQRWSGRGDDGIAFPESGLGTLGAFHQILLRTYADVLACQTHARLGWASWHINSFPHVFVLTAPELVSRLESTTAANVMAPDQAAVSCGKRPPQLPGFYTRAVQGRGQRCGKNAASAGSGSGRLW